MLYQFIMTRPVPTVKKHAHTHALRAQTEMRKWV